MLRAQRSTQETMLRRQRFQAGDNAPLVRSTRETMLRRSTLVSFEKHPSESEMEASISTKVFSVLTMNNALLPVLVFAKVWAGG
ncbi:hypothetical protein CYMTET_11370 [Cymbomonas tetramitiformis]|uniref:Uncharacterized protein n=1 Tax=Cymbomonas tetramitiformis TaxID=36881 RepID=A0AAE0GNV1_9CHLO|nr:hypothetical protein CYMTET_11370 [Cymbomonas tetramitiformis]